MRVAVENFWRQEHYRNGYEILYTPHIGKSWLWETSGHLGFYKANMYSPMEIDNQDYIIKPMNCPFHIMIYKNKGRSYRDLPLRWAELGTVYRYERSGVLHGLLRVRGFTQDDAHIFCTPEQMEGEIREVLRFSLNLWKVFGFKDIKAYLATTPAESVGEQVRWDAALESLRKAVDAEGLAYEIDEGGGAFYGPKIDLKIKDALGREWQMTTIQFDFNEPERFDMTFVDADGQHKRPYMVHRALLGSLERFFGVLIEHFGGAFPVWLAPEQIAVIPVAESFNDYAKKVAAELKASSRESGYDLRVSAELDDGRLNAKIRNCQNRKIPYMLVVGQREADEGTVSIRLRDGRQLPAMKVSEFADYAAEKADSRSLEL
jgi:threonyl-tRNA synthetase